MGGKCSAEEQKLGGGFDYQGKNWSNVEMVPWNNETSDQNLLKNPTAAPANSLGRKSKELPKLYQIIEDSRRRELQSKSLIEPTNRGIVLPPYYINRYKAYYQGEWMNGQPSGLGKLYFENGSYFEGPFVNGEITGQDGIYFYPDGSFKRGTISNGKLEGQGKFVSRNGNFTYEGNWRNDQPNGRGVEIYPDGSKYEGEFVNGVKNDDNATYKWLNGKVYQGPFKNGYMEGYGRLIMSGGKGEYVGEFARNLKVGQGKMKTETGEYEGPFENGEMHGTGVFKWDDGKIYQGQFEQGELHGNGTLYYPNGQMVEGVWHRGENLQLNNVGIGKSTLKI